MSKHEIPMGKRKPLYRFFEILPGMISYLAVILLFVLSWISPFLGAVYLLLIIASTLVKAVATAFRTIQGYKVMKRAETEGEIRRTAILARAESEAEALKARARTKLAQAAKVITGRVVES